MLESLRVLKLVGEHASFRRAAEELGLTRPAISHRIKQLEARFDVPLVDRTTRRVALTPAGRLLVQHAEGILAAVDEMIGAMNDLRAAAKARLVIGASTLPAEKFLSPALVALQGRLAEEGVQIYTRVGNTEQVLAWLDGREIDLAVVGCDVQHDRFECRAFATDSLVLVAPPGAAIAPTITLEQLTALPVILREPGSATRQAVLQCLAEHDVTLDDLNIIAEMSNTDAMMAAVQAGVGCAFFSRNYVGQRQKDIRPIKGVTLRRPLTLCRRVEKDVSPVVQNVFDQLAALLADGSS